MNNAAVSVSAALLFCSRSLKRRHLHRERTGGHQDWCDTWKNPIVQYNNPTQVSIPYFVQKITAESARVHKDKGNTWKSLLLYSVTSSRNNYLLTKKFIIHNKITSRTTHFHPLPQHFHNQHDLRPQSSTCRTQGSRQPQLALLPWFSWNA